MPAYSIVYIASIKYSGTSYIVITCGYLNKVSESAFVGPDIRILCI